MSNLQDKVGDFSGFTPDKLLLETQKALSYEELYERHQQLIKLQESVSMLRGGYLMTCCNHELRQGLPAGQGVLWLIAPCRSLTIASIRVVRTVECHGEIVLDTRMARQDF